MYTIHQINLCDTCACPLKINIALLDLDVFFCTAFYLFPKVSAVIGKLVNMSQKTQLVLTNSIISKVQLIACIVFESRWTHYEHFSVFCIKCRILKNAHDKRPDSQLAFPFSWILKTSTHWTMAVESGAI